MASKAVLRYVQHRINEARQELAQDTRKRTTNMTRKASASMVNNTALDQLATRIADRLIAELERRRPDVVGNYQRRANMQGQGDYYDSVGTFKDLYAQEFQRLCA